MIILQSTVYAIFNDPMIVLLTVQGRFQAKLCFISRDHATQGMEPMQAACDMM